jgi:hypothetical protein
LSDWKYPFGLLGTRVPSAVLDAFRTDLIEVCRRHGMTLDGWGDHDGIQDLSILPYPSERDRADNLGWLFKNAHISEEIPALNDCFVEAAKLEEAERARSRAAEANRHIVREFIEREKARAFQHEINERPSIWESMHAQS